MPVNRPESTVPTLGPEAELARCLGCAYTIAGLDSPGQCPECGRWFDFENPNSFTLRPPFLGWKFWLPGLLTAAGIGIAGLAIGVFGFRSWGWSLWLATPAAMGVLLGFRVRTGPIWMAFLTIVLLGCFVLGMAMLGIGGVFCGLILSALLLGPLSIGVGVGVILRKALKAGSWQQHSWLPLLLISGLLLLCYAIDRPSSSTGAVESVTTSMVLNIPASEAFSNIVFYEQVTRPPPWLLRIGLVRPLYTTGSASSVGDRKVCVYNTGRIVKRITAIVPNRLLSFEIVEQHIGYERDVALRGGSFELVPQGESQTLVRLTTTYEPLLKPRWCWRWGEQYGIHLLHRHVLEGMQDRVQVQKRGLALREVQP